MPFTITYRLVKGAPINSSEYDGSLHNLDDRVLALEAVPLGRGIASVAADGSGAYLIVTYTDSTEETPIKLPIALYRSRGAWEPLTVYQLNDTVFINGAVYPVTYAHTSAGSFDPGGNSGSGLDWYGPPMFEAPANALPEGGDPGQVLTRSSGPDFLAHWDDTSGLPAGQYNGAFLGWQSGTAYWRDPPVTLAMFELSLNDLLLNTTQYWRAPFSGRLIGIDVTAQEGVTTGGTIEVKVAGVSTSVMVTVPSPLALGAGVSDEFSGAIGGYHFNTGYLITLEPVGFSESPPMVEGKLRVTLRLSQD